MNAQQPKISGHSVAPSKRVRRKVRRRQCEQSTAQDKYLGRTGGLQRSSVRTR